MWLLLETLLFSIRDVSRSVASVVYKIEGDCMRENVRKQNLENLIKLLAILAGMIFLFWLWLHRMESGKERPEPEGEKISKEDIHILLQPFELQGNCDEANIG